MSCLSGRFPSRMRFGGSCCRAVPPIRPIDHQSTTSCSVCCPSGLVQVRYAEYVRALVDLLSGTNAASSTCQKDEDEAVLRGVLRRAVSAERLEVNHPWSARIPTDLNWHKSTGTIEDNPYAAAQRILKRISENNTASTTSESDAAALKELSCTGELRARVGPALP